MLYDLLFRLTIWTKVRGMSLWDALHYPTNDAGFRENPFEDAREEISLMME
jgi:hypothetical protein